MLVNNGAGAEADFDPDSADPEVIRIRKQKSVYDQTFTNKIQEELMWLQQQKAAMEELSPDADDTGNAKEKQSGPKVRRLSMPAHPERVANQEISLSPIKHTYGVLAIGAGRGSGGGNGENRARLLTDANGRRLSKLKAT